MAPVAASPAKPTPAAVAVVAPKEEPKAPSAPPAPAPVEPAPADVASPAPAEAPAQPEMAAPAEVMEGANVPGDEKPEEKAEPADENPIVGPVRTVVDAAHGYLDHAAFEQGHSIIAEKVARDKVRLQSLSRPRIRDASPPNP